jgi:hypothetical protein
MQFTARGRGGHSEGQAKLWVGYTFKARPAAAHNAGCAADIELLTC